jgi:hypothetical protein
MPARVNHLGGAKSLNSAAIELGSGFIAEGLVSGYATLVVVTPEATLASERGQPG